jgi:hypothetical protein
MDWKYLKDLFWGVLYSSNNIIQSIPTYLAVLSLIVLWLFPKKKGNEMKDNSLSKARKHALSIFMGFILISVILTSLQLYKNKQTNFATPDELTQSVLRNRDIRLADLTREDFTIRNKTFDNCHIYGPAIMCARDCIITGIIFERSLESSLITTTNKHISGAILLDNCVMKDCTLHRVSFIGTQEQISRIKANVKLKD